MNIVKSSRVQSLSLSLLALSTVFFTACATVVERPVDNQASPADTSASKSETLLPTATEPAVSQAERDWGIRIVGLRTSMAGMMIDFRYEVIDPNKAAPLLDLNEAAYLIVEKSGQKLGVPNSVKIGALRQTTHAKKVKAGRDYFVLFGNPGRKLVQPGDKVAIVIGDFKAEHLTLQ